MDEQHGVDSPPSPYSTQRRRRPVDLREALGAPVGHQARRQSLDGLRGPPRWAPRRTPRARCGRRRPPRLRAPKPASGAPHVRRGALRLLGAPEDHHVDRDPVLPQGPEVRRGAPEAGVRRDAPAARSAGPPRRGSCGRRPRRPGPRRRLPLRSRRSARPAANVRSSASLGLVRFTAPTLPARGEPVAQGKRGDPRGMKVAALRWPNRTAPVWPRPTPERDDEGRWKRFESPARRPPPHPWFLRNAFRQNQGSWTTQQQESESSSRSPRGSRRSSPPASCRWSPATCRRSPGSRPTSSRRPTGRRC